MPRWQELTDRERLLLHVDVDPESGCWVWNGSTNACGYGRVGKGKGWALAHRKSYELFVGDVPDGLEVCHHCDRPACIQPDHLFVATHQENMSDCKNKGRSARQGGESNPRSKLNEDQVRFIRSVGGSHMALAKRFGVSHTLIRLIRQRKAWKHVA